MVLAIGAVALPFTLRQLDRRQEAETIDRLGLLLRLARADARATGVPVIVQIDAAGRVLEARRLDARSDEPTFAESPSDVDVEVGATDATAATAATIAFDDDAELGDAIMASWARVELPDPIRCVPEPAFEDDTWMGDTDLPELDPLDAFEAIDADPWPEVTRLVLLLPDGTAIGTGTFGLATARGWRRCSIEPYGGRLTVDAPAGPDDESAFESTDPERDSDPDPELDADPDSGLDAGRDADADRATSSMSPTSPIGAEETRR